MNNELSVQRTPAGTLDLAMKLCTAALGTCARAKDPTFQPIHELGLQHCKIRLARSRQHKSRVILDRSVPAVVPALTRFQVQILAWADMQRRRATKIPTARRSRKGVCVGTLVSCWCSTPGTPISVGVAG
jgi:hypothetical protein